MKYNNLPQKSCGLLIEEALQRSPELRKYRSSKSKGIDLGNTEALLLYNRLILQDFLNLDFSLPKGFLTPTICSRWEFIKWCLNHLDKSIHTPKILEIGTGASAIIALIFAKIGFRIDATEINEEAYKSAKENITLNKLSSKINLIKVEETIIEGLFPSLDIFDAIISNPPQYDIGFYEKRKMMKKGFVGKKTELLGGELGHEFIIQLIKEAKKFEKHPPIFFQLTQPKLSPSINSYLEKNSYSYIVNENVVGTRKRIYYKIF